MAIPGQAIPFIDVVRELAAALHQSATPYAIIGGVAAARAGGARTTGDIDILTEAAGWARFCGSRPPRFSFEGDFARHVASGITVDVLFAGDDWDLPFVLPRPQDVSEWDPQAEAWFMRPWELVVLKAAVHLAKLRQYGAATAAKDLADVHAILSAHPDLVPSRAGELNELPSEIAGLLRRTLGEISRPTRRGPRRRHDTSE